jgi:curved DNA-binding protein CbpA
VSFDYYQTLGVSPDAPPEVIRAAYRVLAQKHHPDRNDQARDAHEITTRINEAYSVLSDPEQRRAYDEARRSSQELAPNYEVEKVSSRSSVNVLGEAAGHAFTLRFIPGYVISNDLWTDTRVSSRGGSGMNVMDHYLSPRIKTQLIPQQRIGVRTNGGDLFVQQTGEHLPIGCGQEVELVQAFGKDNQREGIVAIVNRSIGRWFWIGSQLQAGSLVQTTGAFLSDLFIYIGLCAFIVGIVWTMFVRSDDLLVWGGLLFLGMPLLLGLAAPIRHRTANKIGDAMREKIHTAANN